MIAPALGALFMAGRWTIPTPIDTFLKLLGGASSPCPLITLGLFLAGNAGRKPEAGFGIEASLVSLKLVGQPLLTGLIAVPILGLPHREAVVAVLLAALPTGTGPFMLAKFYERDALLTGRVVLMTTVLSIVTLSLFLATCL